MEGTPSKKEKIRRKKILQKKTPDNSPFTVNKKLHKGIKLLGSVKRNKSHEKGKNTSIFPSNATSKKKIVSNADEKNFTDSSKPGRKMKNKNKKNKLVDVTVFKDIEGIQKHYFSDTNLKEGKSKKRKLSSNKASKESTNTREGNLKLKKIKCAKKGSVSKTSLDVSDSEEDQEIRDELKSSSIYNSIQNLIKNNPSLLSTADSCDEEGLELSDGEQESEEEDMECSDEESEIDLSILASNKNKKAKIPSEDALNETQNVKNISKEMNKNNNVKNSEKKNKNKCRGEIEEIHTNEQVDKSEEVATTSTISACCFNRTQRNISPSRKTGTVAKKVTPSLKDKALGKLQGAKFRYLNEKLYTESGVDSFDYFQKNREDYDDYHKGYSLQVAKWPLNPVDKIISSLQKMKKNIIVADMGCGDAKIARTLSNCSVHSFDLVALNDFVIPCNISKVPLKKESVDVVIFCLSLMGTNLKEYLQEAYRIVKFGGILKIAEVESRIPNLDHFIKSIETLGFSIEKKNVEHKMFVFLEFKKIKKKKKSFTIKDIALKPCFYKKR